ncbi:MAG: hypothetical protein ACP5PQ_03050 [Thermoproteota archaeon]
MVSTVEEFAEEFLRDVAGIKNPDYATRMLFISSCLMARDDRRRSRKIRKKRRKT